MNLSTTSGVKVAVRICPMRPSLENGDCSIIKYHPIPTIILVDDRPFTFDNVLNPTVTQPQLFQELLQPLIDKFQQGFNCTVLAYGQTGTGKSYSMGVDIKRFDADDIGIIPRCIQELFHSDFLKENRKDSIIQREISVSFTAIYNERVYDLLAEHPAEPIIARGSKYSGGVCKVVESVQDCYDLLAQGTKNRHVRSTKMNSQSSRSHAIFTIHLKTTYKDKQISSCLNLVDLAGSEGVRRTGNQGLAMSEGVHINQGLLCIGKVLNAMALNYKVIPYRDSVLSSVLQDSLNSNSFVTLLACISQHREDLSETLSTLRFAQNAKMLRQTPNINSKEIKRTKMKTPYKSNFKNTPLHKPLVNKNFPNNTFSSPLPSKEQRRNENKLNESEIGLTPKEKTKAQMRMIQASPTPVVPIAVLNTKESIADQSIESRASTWGLNISSSTVVNRSTISPIVRRCMEAYETGMENKLREVMEKTMLMVFESNIKVVKDKMQQVLSTLELQNNEKLNAMPEISSASIDSSSAINNTKATFTTSSPVFKVPFAPVLDSSVSTPCFESKRLRSSIIGPIRSKSVRRSQRILERKAHRSPNLVTQTEGAITRKSRLFSQCSKMCQIDVKTEINTKRKSTKRISTKSPVFDPMNRYLITPTTSKTLTLAKHKRSILDLLNKGSMKELQILPTIGQKTAYQLVTYRTLNGGFKNLTQISKLPIWRGNSWDKFTKANMV